MQNIAEFIVKLGSRNVITIPKEVADFLELNRGDFLKIRIIKTKKGEEKQ